jgi:hypothetical protein
MLRSHFFIRDLSLGLLMEQTRRVPLVDQELFDSCCSIFNFLCSVLQIVDKHFTAISHSIQTHVENSCENEGA